jgi:cation:H+ antiporter
LYFIYLARGFGHSEDEEDDGDDEDDDGEAPSSKLKALLTLDFNTLLFDGDDYSTGSAWVVLTLATGAIAFASWLLADAVMTSADAMGVPPYFTALIFAAAATSVPDTVLSVKDAVRGEYDDALSNAIGSNTFDITVGLGLPLLLYTLIFNTDVMVTSAAETQLLRIVLFGVTVVVLASLLLRKRVTVSVAYLLSAIYAGWMGFVIYDTLVG